jgi:hypothetical protein
MAPDDLVFNGQCTVVRAAYIRCAPFGNIGNIRLCSLKCHVGNVQRLDELVNGPAADVPDRAGDPLYSWRQMMAKNDEIRRCAPFGNIGNIRLCSLKCHVLPAERYQVLTNFIIAGRYRAQNAVLRTC